MIKELFIKIKEFLFPGKNKLLNSSSDIELVKKEENEIIEFEEYNIDYDIENKVSNLEENNQLDSLSIEELRKYIAYFKNKSEYYTEKSNFVDKKIDELIGNNA